MRLMIYLALIPPIFLMYYVYSQDRVEAEPVSLVIKTIIYGALSVIPTFFLEHFAGWIIGWIFPAGSLLYLLVENFLGVALIEEFCKMIACRSSVWNNPNFNYTFDGIVYSVAAAVGFAAIENIMYAFTFGQFSTVIVRAITAIPAHVIFGIFMGVHLGIAKYDEAHGYETRVTYHIRRALLIPILLHGFYDFICSINSVAAILVFYAFIILMDIVAIRTLKKLERQDTKIQ